MGNRHRSRSRGRESSFSEAPEFNPHQVRIEGLLRDELQSLVRDAADPALQGVQVIAVTLSPDASHARVAFGVVAELSRQDEEGRRGQAGLMRAAPFLRARLAEHLSFKKLPRLGFTFVGAMKEPLSA